MTFTENSYLVQLYVMNIQKKVITKEDVPNLYNLRDVVYSIIDAQ